MSAPTQGPIAVEEVCGGFKMSTESVGSGHFGSIGCATQRDPHPIHGGGISSETALANATLWSAAELLLAACEEVLVGSTRAGRCVFCDVSVNDEHAVDCPTIPVRASIRMAKGKR